VPDVDRREEKFVASEPMSCCLLVLFKYSRRKEGKYLESFSLSVDGHR